jgi:phosphatidylglycerophosphate synthase
MSHRQIVEQLAAAQKSNRGAGGYSRWINRPLGRQLAATAYRAGLTPNQVTLISAAFSYAAIAAIALAPMNVLAGVLIGIGLVVGYALDSADGQLARLRGGGSAVGEWLDHVVDAAKVSALHLAIAIAWFRHYSLGHGWLLVPLGYTVVASVFFFAIVLADMLRRIDRVKAGGTSVTTSQVNPHEAAPLLRSILVLPNDYGVLCLALFFIGVHAVFLPVYTVLFAANVLLLLAALARWYTELARM